MEDIQNLINSFDWSSLDKDTAENLELDTIVNKITHLGNTVTTEEYYTILEFLKKIHSGSYYGFLTPEIIKNLLEHCDKGNIKGPLLLFRAGKIRSSLDQVTHENTALSAYILKRALDEDDTYETLQAIIDNTKQTSLFRNCIAFTFLIDTMDQVDTKRLKQFGYLNRVLYLIQECGKRLIENYQEVSNDHQGNLYPIEEKQELMLGFNDFLLDNFRKTIEILNKKIDFKKIEDGKILGLQDTIKITSGIVEYLPFNNWDLSNKHYLLCFIGNLTQGIQSFSKINYLEKNAQETLMISAKNFYKRLNKDDWMLVENHINFRKGETVIKRQEEDNMCIVKKRFKPDTFELFDLQKGYNSVFVAWIFVNNVMKEPQYTHLISSKRLIGVAMYLLYDCLENDIHEDIFQSLVEYLDEEFVQSNLENIKNSNFFDFNIIDIMDRLAKYQTTISSNMSASVKQKLIDLLKKMFYIVTDYIQVKAISKMLGLRFMNVYNNSINLRYLLPQNPPIDAINLRQNPTVQRILIACIEYGINAALASKFLTTKYLSYDFLIRIVKLYYTEDMIAQLSDFDECYISLCRILLSLKKFHGTHKNDIENNTGEIGAKIIGGSAFESMNYEELFRIVDSFMEEVKKAIKNRVTYINSELGQSNAELEDPKATEDKKQNAQKKIDTCKEKSKALVTLESLFVDLKSDL